MPKTPGAISAKGDSGTISGPIVGVDGGGMGDGVAAFTGGTGTGVGGGGAGFADPCSRFSRMISVSSSLSRKESSSIRPPAWTARTINQMTRTRELPERPEKERYHVSIKFPFCSGGLVKQSALRRRILASRNKQPAGNRMTQIRCYWMSDECPAIRRPQRFSESAIGSGANGRDCLSIPRLRNQYA